MYKKHSRIGLVGSLAIHTAIFAGVWYVITHPAPPKFEEQSTLSLEIMAALLQQPEVATAPEPNEEITEDTSADVLENQAESTPEPEKIETPEPVEAVPVVKPTEKPKEAPKPKKQEKPKEKEKPKPKPEPKLKEVPKKVEKVKTAVKAIEKGSEVKQGIVAKAEPNALKSTKVQAGIANGSAQSTNEQGNSHRNNLGNANQTQIGNSASSNEIGAYKALLQRSLQQRANNAYPQREKMMRKMGTVTIQLSVSPSGQVVNVSVINSSGHTNLDKTAVNAAERTKLNSAPPLGFPTSLTVPVRFSLN